MYGIFTYIYHKNQPNVGIYTIHGSYGLDHSTTFSVSVYLFAFRHNFFSSAKAPASSSTATPEQVSPGGGEEHPTMVECFGKKSECKDPGIS